jgi:hypothetical protein
MHLALATGFLPDAAEARDGAADGGREVQLEVASCKAKKAAPRAGRHGTVEQIVGHAPLLVARCAAPSSASLRSRP